jgi:hypothetical protein
VLQIRIRDPGAGAFFTPGSGMGKKLGSGSGMKYPNHISESLETIFWVKILKFFDVDPGSGMKKFGSGINILDPQRCQQRTLTPRKLLHRCTKQIEKTVTYRPFNSQPTPIKIIAKGTIVNAYITILYRTLYKFKVINGKPKHCSSARNANCETFPVYGTHDTHFENIDGSFLKIQKPLLLILIRQHL